MFSIWFAKVFPYFWDHISFIAWGSYLIFHSIHNTWYTYVNKWVCMHTSSYIYNKSWNNKKESQQNVEDVIRTLMKFLATNQIKNIVEN